MAKNKTKVVLSCSGPDRLTKYNPELNEKIEGNCRRDKANLFKPHMCCYHSANSGAGKCAFLEITTYK